MNFILLQQNDEPSKTANEMATALNAQATDPYLSVPLYVYGLVDMVTTMNYLAHTTNIWDRLKKIEKDPAKEALYGGDFVILISKFLMTVQVYPKTNYENFVEHAGALIMLGEITEPEATAFLNMGRRPMTRYEQLGGEANVVVTPQDINAVRWQAQAQAFADEIAVLNQRLASLTGMHNDLVSGNAYHELSEVV